MNKNPAVKSLLAGYISFAVAMTTRVREIRIVREFRNVWLITYIASR